MKVLRRPDVLILILSVVMFTLQPEVDLAVSRLFMEGGRFPIGEVRGWKVVHRGITHFSRIAFVVMLIYVVAAQLRRAAPWARWRRQIAFLMLALALGPGLAVGMFKEHWGRARPGQVMQQGSTLRFTPPLVPSRECDTNCAFVSGHAATGFYFMAVGLAFPRHRRAWFVVGLAAGSAIGLLRMAQGGHFLSDVVFAGILTWFVALALAKVMQPAAVSPEGPRRE